MQPGIQQDGGVGACHKMTKKEQNQFLLIKLGRGKNAFSVRQQYVTQGYRDILGQKIICEKLIQFKNLYEFYRFFLRDFLTQNVLIPLNHILLLKQVVCSLVSIVLSSAYCKNELYKTLFIYVILHTLLIQRYAQF